MFRSLIRYVPLAYDGYRWWKRRQGQAGTGRGTPGQVDPGSGRVP